MMLDEMAQQKVIFYYPDDDLLGEGQIARVGRRVSQGYNPPICPATTSDGRDHSILPFSRESLGAVVASESSCGISTARPSASSSTMRNISVAPSTASRSCSSPAVSTAPISTL